MSDHDERMAGLRRYHAGYRERCGGCEPCDCDEPDCDLCAVPFLLGEYDAVKRQRDEAGQALSILDIANAGLVKEDARLHAELDRYRLKVIMLHPECWIGGINFAERTDKECGYCDE